MLTQEILPRLAGDRAPASAERVCLWNFPDVRLLFEHGAQLSDPNYLLQSEGKQIFQ